ncbi:HAMP domain-containing histidine kinase [bacterium]|nr:HAMP domain-containing histidine kinase [bacterium]
MRQEGEALVCDAQGLVQSVVHDGLKLASRLRPGTSVINLAEDADIAKAQRFLALLQSSHAAYDWEITVNLDVLPETLHFAGGQIEGGYLVIIARTRDQLNVLSDELMRINNEQTNKLRAAAKELSLLARKSVNNDLANLQREMSKANVALAALNEQKNRFLGMAAHDLRTPIGTILIYSEFLETEAADRLDEEQRSFVKIIRDSSQFMLNMIDDLLDVSVIESGQLRLERQPEDIASLIGRVIVPLRALAIKKKIALLFSPSEIPLPAISIDVGKIEQVLNNLVGNAVKYSHVNTLIRISAVIGDGEIRVSVSDQGQGIPKEELTRLFQPFSKTSVRSTGDEKSTGLGLAITRHIVESEVGRGTTFTFTLPILPDGQY